MSGPQSGPPFEREDVGEVTVLRAKLPLLRSDETTAVFFREAVAVVEDGGRRSLLMNLAGVASISSMAIGKLVMLMRQVRKAGGRLALCKLTPTMLEILQMCFAAEIIPIYDDEQEALRSFAGRQ